MKNKQIVITIITHTNKPTEFELISLKQGLKILHKHPFALVVPEGLDVSVYEKLFQFYNVKYDIEFFNNKFFGTLANYNRLVLHKSFYERFNGYEYMLIYHLDCFVFRDEIDYWCAKGYDYFGPPWFGMFDANYKTDNLWLVGNGGFSIRKIDSFIRVLSLPKIKLSFSKLYYYYTLQRTPFNKLIKLPYIILLASGFKNNKSYYLETPFSEDIFWSYVATNIKNPINPIPLNESIEFGFDGNPETLYNMNNKKLPFGCHGWFKYDKRNIDFWTPFIEKEGFTVPLNSK